MEESLFDLFGLKVFVLAAATYGVFIWLDSNASDEAHTSNFLVVAWAISTINPISAI